MLTKPHLNPVTSTPETRSLLDRAAALSFVLLLAYALVRTYWQFGHRPDSMAPGDLDWDLVVFTGWLGVGLCVAGAGVAAGLTRPARSPVARRLLPLAGVLIGVALIASGALLLLDVIGLVFPGIGIEFFPSGAASRLVCVTSGALLVTASVSYFLAVRGACRRCGRTNASGGRLAETPMWAYVAAYVAVAGCVVRVLAQAAVGFNENPLSNGPAVIAFEGAFLLAGSLLPLALVHGWGRVWPRWVPILRRRRIPRWLVLGPGAGVSAGIVVYFGLMLAMMIAERLQGRNPFPPSGGLDLPEVFFWFAVPAYVVWG
ncbi:MAG: hypothetical protein L0K86_07250, partial [Actinomycetia bacterium]|nr:hypothetical protein [Actinomycetes bacterium]